MALGPPKPAPSKATSALSAATTGAATPTISVIASSIQQGRDLHPGARDDDGDGDDGALQERNQGGIDDSITRESASINNSKPPNLHVAATGSDNANDRHDVGCCSSSCPPRFGDGNEEPGSHLQCCCPGVRISYCKLSQVQWAPELKKRQFGVQAQSRILGALTSVTSIMVSYFLESNSTAFARIFLFLIIIIVKRTARPHRTFDVVPVSRDRSVL